MGRPVREQQRAWARQPAVIHLAVIPVRREEEGRAAGFCRRRSALGATRA